MVFLTGCKTEQKTKSLSMVLRFGKHQQSIQFYNDPANTMKRNLIHNCFSLLAVVAATFFALPAQSQEVTGTLGSPSATTTIPGNQLPPPPAEFGGVIKEFYKDSTPWW